MRLKVGKIVNTHSLKGEVKVISSTDFEEERFKKGSKLLITRGNQLIREVIVESYRNHKNFLLVKFEGIDSVEEAEKLKNKLHTYKLILKHRLGFSNEQVSDMDDKTVLLIVEKARENGVFDRLSNKEEDGPKIRRS